MNIGKISKNGGFTLLEAVVAMGILATSFGVIMVVFTQVIQTSNRAQTANEVRGNAAYALGEMAREIQKGERLTSAFTISPDCSITSGSLNLNDSEGLSTVCFGVDNTGVLTCQGLVRDNGCIGTNAFLTSDQVDVSNLSFCRVSENRIRINMMVQQCNESAASRSEYRGSIDLVEEVTLRNYAGYQ